MYAEAMYECMEDFLTDCQSTDVRSAAGKGEVDSAGSGDGEAPACLVFWGECGQGEVRK